MHCTTKASIKRRSQQNKKQLVNVKFFKSWFRVSHISLAKRINMEWTWFFSINRFHDDSTISIGICLPASCSVDRMESVLNEVIQHKINADTRVSIPRPFCQLEEKETQMQTFDLFVMYVKWIENPRIFLLFFYDFFILDLKWFVRRCASYGCCQYNLRYLVHFESS